MPALRTSSSRSNRQQMSPSRSIRPRRRYANIAISKQNDQPTTPIAAESEAAGPVGTRQGLDWDWVKSLNQDPEKGGDFPLRFVQSATHYTGDDDERPEIADGAASIDYTAWVLARVKKTLVSKPVIKMVRDRQLEPRWTIALNSRNYNRGRRHRELKLIQFQSPANNFEAAYAAIVGIVLPPEHACANCKANQGPFQHCIVLPDYLHGACAGCHYNSGGSRCSHRRDARKRVWVDGVPKTIPGSSLIFTQAEKSVSTLTLASKIIGNIKAQLLDMVDQIQELERGGLVINT